MGYDDESSGDEEEEAEVLLGFASSVCEPTLLLRNQLPSKLGGAPAWLDPVNLPTQRQLTCAASGEPLRFVAQLYAASSDEAHAFHRSIFLFMSPKGSQLSRPGAVRAFRCQLPRENAFYPFEPPEADDRPRKLRPAEARLASARAPSWVDAPPTGADPTAGGGAHGNLDADHPPDPSSARVAVGACADAYAEHELYTEAEPADEEAAAATVREDERVRELLQAYRGDGTTAGDGGGGAPVAGGGGSDKPRLVDEDEQEEAREDLRSQDPRVREFGAFTARLARAPAQCIRYVFDDGARPLWAHRSGRAPHPVPPCQLCGGPRRFELQLMPQSLHFLGVDSSADEAPDFATVAIYTCAASCAIWPAQRQPGGSAERGSDAARRGGGAGQGDGEEGALGDDCLSGGWAGLGAPPCVEAGEAMAGRRVRVVGLQARPELNGRVGVVLGWHPQSGRWAVELRGAEPVATAGIAVPAAACEDAACEDAACEDAACGDAACEDAACGDSAGRHAGGAAPTSGAAVGTDSGGGIGTGACGHVSAGSAGDGRGDGACGGAGGGAAGTSLERLRLRATNLESVEGAEEPTLGGYAEEYVWVQLPEC